MKSRLSPTLAWYSLRLSDSMWRRSVRACAVERVALARLVGLVRGDAVIGQRNFRVDGDDALVRQMDDDVRTQAAAFVGQERLLRVEVAQLAHAGQLDAAPQRVLSPRAAHGRRVERVGEARRLALRQLLRC